MSTFNMSFSQSENMNAIMQSQNNFSMGFSVGGKIYSNVAVNTTEYWNSDPNRVSVRNTVYVYSDYRHDDQGNAIPAFKVGDGLAYLIDLPFNDELMALHMTNASIHISDEDRAFWDNKVTCFIDADNEERIIFTKD